MHEWALAESILTTAIETAEREHLKKILEIHVSLGELQQIDEEILRFALDEIQKTMNLSDAKIVIDVEKALFKCNKCGYRWEFQRNELSEMEAEAIHFLPEMAFVHMRCPKCASPDFTVVKGRGIAITSIKGE